MTIFHCFLQNFFTLESDSSLALWVLSALGASSQTPELHPTDYNHIMRNSLFLFIFFVTACAPAPTQNTSSNSLEPYLTATPSLTPLPNVLVIVKTPIPTATPFVYTIQSGDTFSELAEQFKISQDELRAANPDVSPNSMPVGATLLIPDSSAPLAAASTLTPVPAPVTQAVCHPTADNGLWCFALIQNNTPDILENVSAQITLLDEANNTLASQTAFTPLDIIRQTHQYLCMFSFQIYLQAQIYKFRR